MTLIGQTDTPLRSLQNQLGPESKNKDRKYNLGLNRKKKK